MGRLDAAGRLEGSGVTALASRITKLEQHRAPGRGRLIVVTGGAGATEADLKSYLARSGIYLRDADMFLHEPNEQIGQPLTLEMCERVGLTHEQWLELLD